MQPLDGHKPIMRNAEWINLTTEEPAMQLFISLREIEQGLNENGYSVKRRNLHRQIVKLGIKPVAKGLYAGIAYQQLRDLQDYLRRLPNCSIKGFLARTL